MFASEAFAACRTLHGGDTWTIVSDADRAYEYVARALNPRLRVIGLIHEPVLCRDCAQVQLGGLTRWTQSVLLNIQQTSSGVGHTVTSDAIPVELGSLRGAALRIVSSEPSYAYETVVVEVDDGCVRLLLVVNDRSLSGSEFADPTRLIEGLTIERLPRGPVSQIDIRCLKFLGPADFAGFERWAFPPLPPPITWPSYEEFLESLQKMQ